MIKKIITKFWSPLLERLNKPEYLKQIEQAYKAGYTYHQNAAKNDPELLKWISQERYFDT
jgi:hypothetical protein